MLFNAAHEDRVRTSARAGDYQAAEQRFDAAFESQRAAGQPFALIGMVHPELPYMYGDAVVPRNSFDFVVETPSAYPLFAPPNLPLGTTD